MTSRAQHPGVHQPRIRRYLAQVRLVMLSGSTPTSKSENIGPSFPIPMRLLSQKLIVSIYSGLLQRGVFSKLLHIVQSIRDHCDVVAVEDAADKNLGRPALSAGRVLRIARASFCFTSKRLDQAHAAMTPHASARRSNAFQRAHDRGFWDKLCSRCSCSYSCSVHEYILWRHVQQDAACWKGTSSCKQKFRNHTVLTEGRCMERHSCQHVVGMLVLRRSTNRSVTTGHHLRTGHLHIIGTTPSKQVACVPCGPAGYLDIIGSHVVCGSFTPAHTTPNKLLTQSLCVRKCE